MKRGLSSQIWPLALLAVGALVGWGAETAVGRFQNYQAYGLARPVADLLLLLGGVSLIVSLVRLWFARPKDLS